MPNDALKPLREAITTIDTKLLHLVSERRHLTNQVAETKIAHHIPVRDQKREEQLLVRLIKEGKKVDLDPHYVTQLFHVIIEDSVLNQQAILQRHLNQAQHTDTCSVAFLGGTGSYSYLACKKYFSHRYANTVDLSLIHI